MKKLLLLTAALLLTSCGAINDKCGGDVRLACDVFFGELPEENGNRIAEIEKELSGIKLDMEALNSRVEVVIEDMEGLNSLVTEHGTDIEALEEVIESSISEVVKPCPGAKEVLLVTGDNRVIGYFEHGDKRYLSLLVDGNYRTTDGTRCNFSVANSGTTDLVIE